MSLIQRLFSDVRDVDLAQSEVDSARGRLSATFEEIQQRIAPSTLMDEALEQVKTRSSELARSTSELIRERPATAAATAAGIGLLLAAKPLSRLFAGRKRKVKEPAAPKPRSPRTRRPRKTAS